MSLVVLNGPTIAAGDSLSDGLDCSAGPIVKITMPTGWVGDTLTFQTSSDGVGYNDVFDPSGFELKFKVIAGTGIIGMRLQTGFVKFRSGTRESPVVQPAIRTFAVALDVADAAPAGNELRVRLLGDNPAGAAPPAVKRR
jgi:hypothetical protein